MSDKFVVEGAICTCKFGTTPAKLKVMNNTVLTMNGGKKVADTMNLGAVFDSPMFTMCNMTYPPKPCSASIVQWSGAYKAMSINKMASPLLPNSKGTCAVGGPQCIEFILDGQIAMPSMAQIKKVASEFLTEMDPCGESLALNDSQIGAFMLIDIK